MIIRNMNQNDIEFAYHCTSNEGWEGETRQVFKGFLSFDPKGCFIAEIDSQKIGMSVAVAYQKNGFIGEVLITKEMRGRGYGRMLFEHTVKYLKSKGLKNIFLDADLDAVALYEKFGFRKITRSLRFNGQIEGKKSSLVNKATMQDIKEICLLDRELFGDDRSFFLKRRQRLFPGLCFVSKNKNSINGYIFGYPGVDVVSVGPFAVLNNTITPGELLATFASEVENDTLHAGVLESNSRAVDFFNSRTSLSEGIPSWRMGLGTSEKLGSSKKLYAIGSAAKG